MSTKWASLFQLNFIFRVHYCICLLLYFNAKNTIENFTKRLLINYLLEHSFPLGEDAEKVNLIHTHCGSVAGRERLIIEWTCL